MNIIIIKYRVLNISWLKFNFIYYMCIYIYIILFVIFNNYLSFLLFIYFNLNYK